VSIHCNYGNGKTLTKNTISHGFDVLNYILGLITEKRPLLFIGLPGFAFTLIGFSFSMPYTLLAGFFVLFGALGIFLGLMLTAILNIKGLILGK